VKLLYYFAADLSRKLITKFHQDRSSFVGDIKKWSHFFWTQCTTNIITEADNLTLRLPKPERQKFRID